MKQILLCAMATGLLLGATSCHDKTKEAKLQQWEQSLQQRETEWANKDRDYQKLVQMRDSLRASQPQDSLMSTPLPFDMTGSWNGKIVCTESNCQEYVVGDVRVDRWELKETNGVITLLNYNKSGVVRSYTGDFDGQSIRVKYSNEPDAQKKLDLKIDLSNLQPNRLSGVREAKVDEACTAKFSIELTR
ncbi:hypothetical protein [Bergeyella sp. RCAD1439]|uniref:hypothetical protein n=1 Tax=Bergeyella anatis TaxID=3113737 RepID=UPI002E17EED4|nr:hypothetical protein [Bergeyella sp. RCAD1439]